MWRKHGDEEGFSLPGRNQIYPALHEMREDEAGDAMIAEICLALGIGWFAGAYMMIASFSKKAKAGGMVSLDGVIYRLTEVGK